jgi:hypothetical protein
MFKQEGKEYLLSIKRGEQPHTRELPCLTNEYSVVVGLEQARE